MEMPKPAPEMESFKWMVGKWRVIETHEPGPMGPGGAGAGTMTVTLGPGGFSHIMHYESNGPMGKFTGHGISAWDADKKKFVGSWTDSMTPGLMMSECSVEGKDMTCKSDGTMQGQKMSMGDGPMQKMMTLEYKPLK